MSRIGNTVILLRIFIVISILYMVLPRYYEAKTTQGKNMILVNKSSKNITIPRTYRIWRR